MPVDTDTRAAPQDLSTLPESVVVPLRLGRRAATAGRRVHMPKGPLGFPDHHNFALADLPDPELVTQLFGVLEGLIGVAARSAVERGSEQELEKAQELLERFDDPSIEAPQELIDLFVEASGNLVLRMVARGLKTQFMERIRAGVEPPPPCAHFAPVARELARSLAQRDPEAAAQTVQRLMAVLRDHILEGLEAKRAGANGGAVGESA